MSSSSGGLVPGDVMTPNPLHNTSKYKVYVQAVDRALKTFENPNEWADLISALAKLAKVRWLLHSCLTLTFDVVRIVILTIFPSL